MIQLQFSVVPRDRLDTCLNDPQVLAVFGFGTDAHPASEDPRYLQVPLRAHGEAPLLEVWRSGGQVRHGREDIVQWAQDDELQFAAIEIDEDGIDIEQASAQAYIRMNAFMRDRGYPHALRIWNYLDAITEGDGDDERYRRFCVGRVRGIEQLDEATLPAATCIGCHDGRRRLQIYWLASRQPGRPLENPRQLSAYRYPRQYGPQSPSFARAMLPPAGADMPLLLSGTASIVGHATRHPGDVPAQLEEIFANLEALRAVAGADAAAPLATLDDPATLLKVYVREPQDLAPVAALLDQRLGTAQRRLVLHGEVCRADLAVEIEGVVGTSR